MQEFKQQLSLRWADMDMNFHLRHSAYYDFGAQIRMDFLEKQGLTVEAMKKHHFGPVLFREECVFRREIRFGDIVFITIQLLSSKADYSRYAIQHQFINEAGKICAVSTVEGAWMDIKERKLITPPEFALVSFQNMPLAENYTAI